MGERKQNIIRGSEGRFWASLTGGVNWWGMKTKNDAPLKEYRRFKKGEKKKEGYIMLRKGKRGGKTKRRKTQANVNKLTSSWGKAR